MARHCLFALCLSAVLPARAAELVLVEQGRPRAQVVVADKAPEAVRQVAADFARIIRRMSGAELAVVGETDSDPARPRVIIGEGKLPAEVTADPSVLTGDEAYAGYLIVCAGQVLMLRGNTPAGTANAVYGFLQDQLGVRWLMPTETFEVVPARTTVRVREQRQVVKPSFVCRLASGSGNQEFADWTRRNRWDVGNPGFVVPYAAGFRHWMYALFPPSRFAEKHPDIYPVLGGKRAIPKADGDQLAQPCTGNPETARLAIETINAYLDAHPECHTYPFSINDNNTWCECDLCRAQDVERPLYRGRKIYSDRWYTFVNAVARGVRAKHPDKVLGCFAYAGVEPPPLKIDRLEPNVFINVTQDTAQYFDPAYRQVDYDLIRAWQAKCPRVGKYDYYGLGALAPRSFPHLAAADLKAIHQMGARAFHSELYPYWANMGPLLYVASRLLWDVSLDPERLLGEFYSAFGPAAGEMRAFYQVLETAWMSQQQGKWFGGIGRAAEQLGCFTAAQVAEAAAHLKRAEELAGDPTAKARVRMVACGYAYPDLLLAGWTAAREARGAKVSSVAEARALAARLEALLQCLDGEEPAHAAVVAEAALIDPWYRPGRPQIRAQWRSTVHEGLTSGMVTLGAWRQTPQGQQAGAETQAVIEQIEADPQAGFLWLALQGKLKLGPNLLPNAGFEEARKDTAGPAGPEWNSAGVAAGWSTWQEAPRAGVFYLDQREKHSGKVSGAFKGGGCLCYITTVPIETGKTYLADGWANAPAVREGTEVTLEVRWQDAAGKWFQGSADLRQETKQAGRWERLLLPFTAPEGASKAVILLVGYGIHPDDVVRFDDLFVGEATR